MVKKVSMNVDEWLRNSLKKDSECFLETKPPLLTLAYDHNMIQYMTYHYDTAFILNQNKKQKFRIRTKILYIIEQHHHNNILL